MPTPEMFCILRSHLVVSETPYMMQEPHIALFLLQGNSNSLHYRYSHNSFHLQQLFGREIRVCTWKALSKKLMTILY